MLGLVEAMNAQPGSGDTEKVTKLAYLGIESTIRLSSAYSDLARARIAQERGEAQ